MGSITRVEIPLKAPSKIFSKFRVIGDLIKNYPNLKFVKYIFLDPLDNKMKASNPKNDLPLVENAYITFIGEDKDIIKFTNDAVKI